MVYFILCRFVGDIESAYIMVAIFHTLGGNLEGGAGRYAQVQITVAGIHFHLFEVGR